MAKIYKSLTIPLLFLLIFPMTIMLCCCIGESATHSHSYQHAEVNHEHGHNHEDGKSGSHNHGQCDHNQLLSPFLVKQSAQFFECFFRIFKLHEKSLPLESSSRNTSFAFWQVHDTGPPGFGHSSTPLYLEISVLRI